MFSYYGCKNKLAKHYPAPKYDTIIEPFSGAAFYSLYGDNWKKEVYLYDKYELIVNLWKYLISVTPQDILDLPILKAGENVETFNLNQESKWLIGFFINSGSAMPKKTVQKFNGWTESKRQEIANSLYKIRHWKAECKEYDKIDNEKASWFTDPPYQFGGVYYRHSNKLINYKNLADWCKSRQGQVIVCENSKANWLDFKYLTELKGQLHKTTEVVWINE